ncbi:MAG: phosphate uptake regulator PhoU [Nitrososphaeria archaeon]|nr:phosphate uptake regulator PhoU [Nitrososphaeria archaeon]
MVEGEQFRRVQQVGEGTFSITLPKQWAKERGLKRGELVAIIEEPDGSLRVQLPRGIQKEVTATINAELCSSPIQLIRLLIGCYLQGYNVVKIQSLMGFTDEQLTEITKTVDRLPAIEIIEQNPQHIIIQSFIDPGRFPVEGLLKRVQVIVSSMLGQVVDLVARGDENIIKSIGQQEERIDELYFLIIRILFTYFRRRELGKVLGIDSPLYVVGTRIIVKSLEEIADYVYDISLECLNLKRRGLWFEKSVSLELQRTAERVQEIFDKCMKALFSQDISLADEVIKEVDERAKGSRTGVELSGDPRILPSARYISWSLEYIANECKIIAETVFNRFVRESTPICSLSYETP